METDNEKLIDYIDKRLTQDESARIENALKGDTDLKREFLYLNFAIDTVRLDAISQKVASVRQLQKKQLITRSAPAVVRTMYKISLRVAAIVILFISVAAVYKYASVSSQSIYDKQFAVYELSNSRGMESQDAETNAYQNKKWTDVISIYKAEKYQSNQQSFLAAMAEMQLNHFNNAITIFENLLNSKSGGGTYVEESEYYLALAYLMHHDENKAVQMINKIKENPNHTYYPMVSKISPIDLKIIEIKNK